ncbi:thermonuclease family protein [Heyndrickxia sp. MSNUG]|uniref:thermonuclease family protein n=1 Tax=Heyndrickxia sp. MSNUG TaxID=3136677 RepID=UPI003C2B945D
MKIKIVKLVIMIVVLLFLLFSSFAAPIGLIGVAIYLAGMWLFFLKLKGKSYSEKPWMFLTAGAIITVILVLIFVEPAPEETKADVKSEQLPKKDAEKLKNEQIKKEKEEKKAKELAEQKAKEEAEEKAKLEAEAKAKAEEEAKAKAEAEAKAQEEATLEKLGLMAVTVGRVVDGDTIETTDGQKIRFIGVNTPESTTKTEPFGKEASNYTTSKLDGQKVWIQKDVSETDRYGRLLRIIWLAIPTDDTNETEIRTKMFNADLVLNGYAEPSTYPPDVKYSEYFVMFAREARESGTGLWAYGTDGTTKGDLDPRAVAKAPATTPSKSNTTTTKPAATTTAPARSSQPEYFANCTELRKVYPNGVPSTHPAYQPKMDRDKDDFACER